MPSDIPDMTGSDIPDMPGSNTPQGVQGQEIAGQRSSLVSVAEHARWIIGSPEDITRLRLQISMTGMGLVGAVWSLSGYAINALV
jgi:hypothetical protein